MNNLKKQCIVMILTVLLICSTSCGKLLSENNGFNSEPNETENESDNNITKSSYKIGDIVSLGQYDLDGNDVNGKETIRWKVLEIQHGEMLLLSQSIINDKEYTAQNKSSDWEKSDIRSWLNDDFYNNAFSEEEKKMIRNSTSLGINGSNNTEDNIFILSEDEILKYLPGKEERTTGSTWWCRSGGDVFYCILGDGTTVSYGIVTNAYGIRPAMWVEIQ